MLTFVSAVASNDESSVLTAVQLLWVNLIMDTFAALALATDPPSPSMLHRKPEPKSAPLISLTMWKMIVGQSIYQLVVTFILFFGGVRILSYDTVHEQNSLQTLIFNVFVWMQIFNQYKYVYSGSEYPAIVLCANILTVAVAWAMVSTSSKAFFGITGSSVSSSSLLDVKS